ncbi:hypothetical protein DAI22_01g427050 [Oryza sativa Japonica Group]|nr:hypothetical protein DAI22_01g427050 [Oryza sativa Japonica Group]
MLACCYCSAVAVDAAVSTIHQFLDALNLSYSVFNHVAALANSVGVDFFFVVRTNISALCVLACSALTIKVCQPK